MSDLMGTTALCVGGHVRKPLPKALSEYVADDFKLKLKAMARAILEAVDAKGISASEKGDLVIASRWAREIVDLDDFVVHPGPCLTFDVPGKRVIGPSRKGSWRIAKHLWANRHALSPENRPEKSPGHYKAA